MIVKSTLIATMLLLGAPQALAVEISLQPERTQVQVGEDVLLTLRVRGVQSKPEVRPPQPAGATLSARGEAQARPVLLGGVDPLGLPFHRRPDGSDPLQRMLQSLQNAAKSLPSGPVQGLNAPSGLMPDPQAALGGLTSLTGNDYTVTYRLQPHKPGKLTVPPFAVTADGQTFATRPLILDVSPARPQNWARAQMDVSKPRFAQGEQAELYFDLFVQRHPVQLAGRSFSHLPLRRIQVTLPDLDGDASLGPVRPLEQVLHDHAAAPGKKGFRVNDHAAEVMFVKEPADAKISGPHPNWLRYRLAVPVRPREPGSYEIPPFRVSGEVYVVNSVASTKPGVTTPGRWERFVAVSRPLQFEVTGGQAGKPSPPARVTAPAGQLRLSTSASQTRVVVGAPFTLTLRVEGGGSLDSLAAPDLASDPEFAQRFQTHFDAARTLPDGAREFTYTLRASHANVREIPAVALTCSDPHGNGLLSSRSRAIPLQVVPAAGKTATAMPLDSRAPAGAPVPLPETLLSTSRKSSRLPRLAVLIGLPTGFACLALALLVARRMRGRGPKKPSPQPQHHIIAAQVRQRLYLAGKSPEQVRKALGDYLRLRFQLPPGEITPVEAEMALSEAGVDLGLVRECSDLLEACAAAEFAPGLDAASDEDLAAWAEALLRKLGRTSSAATQQVAAR